MTRQVAVRILTIWPPTDVRNPQIAVTLTLARSLSFRFRIPGVRTK